MYALRHTDFLTAASLIQTPPSAELLPTHRPLAWPVNGPTIVTSYMNGLPTHEDPVMKEPFYVSFNCIQSAIALQNTPENTYFLRRYSNPPLCETSRTYEECRETKIQ